MAAYDPDKHCGGQRANQPAGVLCTRPKGWGTNHLGIGRCKRHGGSTPTHKAAASKEIARRECAALGLEIDTTPGEALLAEVRRTAGNEAFYRALVQELPVHPADDEQITDEGGKSHWTRGEPGIYGRTYHQSGIPTGEGKPHVLVQMWMDERKHLENVTTAALRAGVEEARLRLAAADASRIDTAQAQAFLAMGLGDRVEEFKDAFINALRAQQSPDRRALSAG